MIGSDIETYHKQSALFNFFCISYLCVMSHVHFTISMLFTCSCINTYVHSYLKPLSEVQNLMFKSIGSGAI